MPLGDLKNPHNHRQNVFEGFYAAIDLTTLKYGSRAYFIVSVFLVFVVEMVSVVVVI